MKRAANQEARVFYPFISDRKHRTIKADLSTYEGHKGDEKIFCKWRGFFIGEAYTKALDMKNNDSIILTDARITNNFDHRQKKLFVTLMVFDFEFVERNN